MHAINHRPFTLAALLLATFAGTAAAKDCAVGYGKLAELQRCGRVELPDFVVESAGTSQPIANVPLICWHYRIDAKETGTSTEIRQCHTGALGGEQDFSLDGHTYTVLFDLREDCGRLANGSWAPLREGHAFLRGTRDSDAAHRLRRRSDELERRCFDRHSKPG